MQRRKDAARKMEPPETEGLEGTSGRHSRCEDECSLCEDDSARGRVHSDNIECGLSGWGLALAAVVSFILPLGMGIAGASLAGEGTNRRFAGVCIGLGAGVLAAWIFARVFAKTHENKVRM